VVFVREPQKCCEIGGKKLVPLDSLSTALELLLESWQTKMMQ